MAKLLMLTIICIVVAFASACGSDARSAPGGEIAFTSCEKRDPGSDKLAECEIHVINPDGSGQKFISKGFMAEWSPDAERIAYINGSVDSRLSGGRWFDIWVYDIDGSQRLNLPDSGNLTYSGDWRGGLL